MQPPWITDVALVMQHGLYVRFISIVEGNGIMHSCIYICTVGLLGATDSSVQFIARIPW